MSVPRNPATILRDPLTGEARAVVVELTYRDETGATITEPATMHLDCYVDLLTATDLDMQAAALVLLDDAPDVADDPE